MMRGLGGQGALLISNLILLGVIACGTAATATSPSPATALTPGPAPSSGPGGPGPSSTPTGSGGNGGGDERRSAAAAASGETPTPPPPGPPPEVPALDKSIHSVPLEDILFDTFGGSPPSIPLDRASDDVIRRLRDAIKPIARPVYGASGDLPWLDDDKLVLGYRSQSAAYAYPVNVLDFHEIVNDVIDGVPVLVTYCPLCFSGVVFSRELDGRALTFGNTSALYQSDLVMYDHQTGSYWFQVGGEAVVGPLTGSRLALLPSATMAWGEWRRLYPETRLLTGTASAPAAFADGRYGKGFSGGYQDRINEDRVIFPVDTDRLDSRLPSGEIVLTVEVGDAAGGGLRPRRQPGCDGLLPGCGPPYFDLRLPGG